jgi:hypothetical protein
VNVNRETGELMVAPPSAMGLISTEQQRAIAEVQAAMIIARMNPRDEKRAEILILQDCERPSFVETALYAYARGGTDITGLSIHAAQAMAQRWGNIQWGTRELEQRDGESIMQSYAWDLQTNAKKEMVFTVPHVRETRDGFKDLNSPRDVYELTANQGSRRTRACLLGVIPDELADKARKKVDETLLKLAEPTPERVERILVFFKSLGVNQGQVEATLQRKMDALKPIHMVRLIKIANSLKDGMSAPGDWFKGASQNVVPMPRRQSGGAAEQQQQQGESPQPAVHSAADQPSAAGGSQASEARPEPAASAPATTASAPASPAPSTSTADGQAQSGRTVPPLNYKGQAVRILRVWQPDPKKNGRMVETSEGLATCYSTSAVTALEEAAKKNLPVKFTGKATSWAPAPFKIEEVQLDTQAMAKASAPPSMPSAGDIFGGHQEPPREREPGEEG